VYYRFEKRRRDRGAGLLRRKLYRRAHDVTWESQAQCFLGTAAEFDGELAALPFPPWDRPQSSIEVWIKLTCTHLNAIYNSDSYPDGAVHFQLIDNNKLEFAMNGNAPEDVNLATTRFWGRAMGLRSRDLRTNTESMIVYVNGSRLTRMFTPRQWRDH
jgi:hypothetical protein